MYVYVCVCVCVCVPGRWCVYVCASCMYVCVCVCIRAYVCICVCVCVCKSVRFMYATSKHQSWQAKDAGGPDADNQRTRTVGLVSFPFLFFFKFKSRIPALPLLRAIARTHVCTQTRAFIRVCVRAYYVTIQHSNSSWCPCVPWLVHMCVMTFFTCVLRLGSYVCHDFVHTCRMTNDIYFAPNSKL